MVPACMQDMLSVDNEARQSCRARCALQGLACLEYSLVERPLRQDRILRRTTGYGLILSWMLPPAENKTTSSLERAPKPLSGSSPPWTSYYTTSVPCRSGPTIVHWRSPRSGLDAFAEQKEPRLMKQMAYHVDCLMIARRTRPLLFAQVGLRV